MPIIDKYHVYTVTAGDPKEDDENKIFLKQHITFEEADTVFDSLMGKKEYPVILLDEGDITIRGFIAPDKEERDQKYMFLKEDLYRESNPDKKPLYIIRAYKNIDQDKGNAGTKRKAYKLMESDSFGSAYSKYLAFYDDCFSQGRTPYNCVQIIDKESRRTIDSRVYEPEKTVEAVKHKKRREDPGYER